LQQQATTSGRGVKEKIRVKYILALQTTTISSDEIHFSLSNYHNFSGWPLRLLMLRFWPSKLPLSDFLAQSIHLCRQF